MLYAIAGSQGTGKSTLLNALPQYPNIVRKTSRSILDEWGVTLSQVNNDRPLTVKFQEEILKRKIEDEAAAAASPDIFMTERTTIDLAAYAIVALGKDNEYSNWLDSYCAHCFSAMSNYKGVFYLTGGHFQPVNDGVRAINTYYSRMVDLLMADLYNQHGDTTWVTQPDLNWRVELVTKHING